MFLALLAAATVALIAACGGPGQYRDPDATPPPASTPATAATPATAITPAPTELRVAFINLMSPVSLDQNSTVASDTFDERLGMVIDSLRAFQPDIVGLNEATITKAHGSAAAKIASELKMEIQYVRANPWFPGQTREQNDAIAKQIGYEEGDVILTRSAFPILRAEPKWLNPRTSETEGRAALHVVVKGPPATGDIDVYITHLTGGGEKVRTAQAQGFVDWIGTTRGNGPLVVMGDLSDGPDTTTYATFTAAGLADLGAREPTPWTTCCLDSVIHTPEQPGRPITQRTDFIFVDKLPSVRSFRPFPGKPRMRADGTFLEASDHEGLTAAFALATGP